MNEFKLPIDDSEEGDKTKKKGKKRHRFDDRVMTTTSYGKLLIGKPVIQIKAQ